MPEANQFSIQHSRSPYKIQVAPGFKADASDDMYRAFLANRGEEEARNNQHKQLIGNLDSLSSDFVSLFSIMSTIRNKMNETSRLEGVDREHLHTIRKIIASIDKINTEIVNKIIPEIDELGR